MEDLEKLKTVDIRTVDREGLVDIARLSKTGEDGEDGVMGMKAFLEAVKNPYCFMVGNVIVKSSFSGEASLEQRIREMAEG